MGIDVEWNVKTGNNLRNTATAQNLKKGKYISQQNRTENEHQDAYYRATKKQHSAKTTKLWGSIYNRKQNRIQNEN